MPTDIIEMLWGCTACNASNRGRDMECKGCGQRRSEKSPEWMPGDTSHAAAVVDPTHIAWAKAGEHWKCRFCSGSVRAVGDTCDVCLGTRTKKKSVRLTPVAPKSTPPIDVATENSVNEPPAQPEPNAGYRSSGLKREPSPDVVLTDRESARFAELLENPPPPGPRLRRLMRTFDGATAKRNVVWGVGVVVATGLVVLLCWWLFHTRIVHAQVVGKTWERSVAIERYSIHAHDGWVPDADAFDIESLGQRVHHYDRVRVGSHQESYSVSEVCGQDCSTTPRRCTSSKNGFGTCTGGDRVCSAKYCNRTKYRTVDDYESQPRYRPFYAWKLWEWAYNRTVRAAGTVDAPEWPNSEAMGLCRFCGPKEEERMASRSETYTLRLHSKEENEDLRSEVNIGTFNTVKIGDSRRLKVGIVHGVEVLP